MQFRCGLSESEKRSRLKSWHKRFAWLPKTVDVDSNGVNICVWLGYYLRKGEYYWRDDVWDWEYKLYEN